MQTDDQDAAFIAGADATPVPDAPASGTPDPAAEKAAETAAQPEGDQPEAGKEGEGEEKPKQTPWFQKRIDELTRLRYEEKRRADAYEAELARFRQPASGESQQPGEQPNQPARDPVEVAKEQLLQEQAVQSFNDRCNGIYEQGTKDFPDFEQTLTNFRYLGGLPPALVQAAAEAGDAHKILYGLGKNPDEAARILSLPPAAMGAALAKMAAAPAAAKPVSAAPPPIKPIAGQGRVETDPDKMPIDQWMKWHDDQQAKRAR